MYLSRLSSKKLLEKLLNDSQIVIIYGPRQSGKTTLVQNMLKQTALKSLAINADEAKYLEVLSSRDFNQLQKLVSGYELVFIDEAQRVPDIGINLKILHDNLPDLKILVTGSSSFDLATKINEPLTGRTYTITLYPVSYEELGLQYNSFERRAMLDDLLIFGSYPHVFSLTNSADKIQYLHELSTTYLYKDIFELAAIKHHRKIHDLLRLLAFQIGDEVSYQELGEKLGMSKDTVSVYIDLLEKSFVIFRLNGYNRNLRKEVSRMPKIYFYDLGIRNTLVENMNTLAHREDVGKLWENFLIAERIKKMSNNQILASSYFWRTYTGAEIDYIEEGSGLLSGYEFKYGRKDAKVPTTWQENYPKSTFQCINRDNYDDFIG